MKNALRPPDSPFRAAAAIAALVLAACGGPTKYVHPGLDAGAMKRVAVLPFENLTQDRVVGEKAQRLLILELLAARGYEVIEASSVRRVLGERSVENAAALTPEDLTKLGKLLKADGLFFGTILEYADGRGGVAPAAAVQLRLADGASGVTVWSTRVSRNGVTFSQRLFGVGQTSPTDVLAGILHDALRTLR